MNALLPDEMSESWAATHRRATACKNTGETKRITLFDGWRPHQNQHPDMTSNTATKGLLL